VLALGMLVAAIRWLTEQLGHEALTVHLAFPPKVLASERELVELLLEGEVTSGTVVVKEQTYEEAIGVAQAARNAISDLVVVSLGSVPPLPKGQRTLHLSLAAASPSIYEVAPRRGDPPEAEGDPWSEWCDDCEDLLRWLV
jgi:hypothetical protein